MPVLRSPAFSTKAAIVAALSALMVTGGYAQQQAGSPALPEAPTNQAVLQNYAAPKPVLSVIGPYTTREVPPINLGNSPRLDSLIKSGVIMLSMSDAITLALQDNLDIDIARYNLPIADTDILRTKGGGQPLGVATGVVSGTPGGTGTGVSGGALTSTASSAGGTTAGTGGAGAGTSGLVLSSLGAGPAAPQFDPSVIGNLQIQRAIYPQAKRFGRAVGDLAEYQHGELQLLAGVRHRNQPGGDVRQYAAHHQQHFCLVHSRSVIELPTDADAAPAARAQLGGQQPLYHHFQKQSRDHRRIVPPADYLDRGADPGHLLGPGERLRRSAGKAGDPGVCRTHALRQQEAVADRHAGSDRRDQRGVAGGDRAPERHRLRDQLAVATALHHQCAQP